MPGRARIPTRSQLETLRRAGVVRFSSGDLSIEFGPAPVSAPRAVPQPTADDPPELAAERARKRAEALLFASSK